MATDSTSLIPRAGAVAERVSSFWLRLKGYRILQHNFRVRGGELDIVASRGDTLVFVEVKYRKSDRFGKPDEFVDFRKQKRLKLAAQSYMACHNMNPEHVNHRFDVVAIEGLKLHHIVDAFS